VAAGGLSICASISLAMIMGNNKKLLEHPNRLIYYMVWFEAMACYNAFLSKIGIKVVTCYFGWNIILNNTVLFGKTSERALDVLAYSN